MGFSPFAPSALLLQAATPAAGVSLVNGTPAILSWTAPADGLPHRVLFFGEVTVTSAEIGGAIAAAFTDPGGAAHSGLTMDAGGHANGSFVYTARAFLIGSGSTVTISQTSALTAGTAVAWAEIWGS